MGIIKYKPTSPGRRFQSVSDFAEITSSEPVKRLLKPLNKKGGRNSYGRITARHIGGGHKQKYRIIDFCRPFIGYFQHDIMEYEFRYCITLHFFPPISQGPV